MVDIQASDISNPNAEPPDDFKKEKTEPKKADEKPAEVLVPISSEGIMAFNNQKELFQAAALAIKIKKAPDHLISQGVEAVMAALMMCKQLNLPDRSMSKMAFIKGKLTAFGSLVTALAERHDQYGERQDFFLDKDQNVICMDNKNLNAPVWAAVVRTKKKDGTVWNEYFFTLDEAKQAGLKTDSTKSDSGWLKYTKDLLFHKANKRMVDANYASAVEGLDYYEDIVYDEDLKKMRDVTSVEDLNAELCQK